MKLLILLRHAKSSWDDSRLDDHDRPLAERGHRDAPLMGERLARHELHPGLLLTSSAQRAQQTAGYIAAALGLPASQTRVERRLYLASPAEMLSLLAEIDDTIESLLLLGHNPGLTELANRLLPALRLDNLPTTGVVAIDGDATSWSRFDRAPLTLRFYDFPKRPGGDPA